jgi:hypothetical protein
VLDEDGTTGTQSAAAREFDELYANISTADAIGELMDYKSKDSDSFTFIMDDADPAQSYAVLSAVGAAAVSTSSPRSIGCGIGTGFVD